MADSASSPTDSTPQLNDQSITTASPSPIINGSNHTTHLSPAQQRQLEADSQVDTPSSSSTSPKHRRKPSTPPNILSEGDFPSLGGGSSKPNTPSKSPLASWGLKKSTPTTTNGVNGKASSSASSTRASTPALPSPAPRMPTIPGTKNLQSSSVTEIVRFQKHQLQFPNAKDFSSVCDKIKRMTGVDKINVSRMNISEVVTFSIIGKAENVVKAKNRLLNEVGVKRIEKVACPVSVLPFIIGKKGVTLKNIQDLSGANVKVPMKKEDSETTSIAASDDVDEETVEVSIEGVDAAVTKAKEELYKIIDEKTSKKVEKLVDIPADFFLLIAGPNDSNIQEWEGPADKDIKIRIPNPHSPSAEDQYITLVGHRDLIAEVRPKIEAKYAQLKATTASATVDVPRSQHRFLIGDKGDGIKSFLAETGCAVIVPPLNVEAGDAVVIRSERAKVGVGLGKVLERAAEVSLVSVDLLSITGADSQGVQHARDVYRYAQKKGLFAKLATEGVNLTIPRFSTVMSEKPSFVFEIDGKDGTKVQQVETSLRNLFTSLPRDKFAKIEIDPCLHGILIGKKGAGIQSIKSQFNVSCLFENEEDADPEILLIYEGTESPKDSLTSATEYMKTLASQTADIEERTLQVNRKYHKIIVGPNGTTLNALIGDQSDRSTGTRVHVYIGGKSRDPEKQEDVVIVRGPKREMERVAKNIADHVSEAKHTEFLTSHVEEFSIPSDYSKNIIGKGGKRIQELRERFGVQLRVDEGKVHIQGVKKNAEETKKVILNIVNELKDDTIERIHVKNEHHGHLIGEKGANVRRLQERYSVRIHFPRREDEEERNSMPEEEKLKNADEIVVRGPSKGAKSAAEELKALLEYRVQHSHTAEVEILARGRRRLLRNPGGIIHTLRQDPGHVRLDVPTRSESETDDTVIKIKVEGTKSFVDKAVKEIGSLRDEVKGETIRTLTVDQKHHKSLIGPGGRTIQKLIVDAGGPEDRSAQARIVRFPRPGDDSDKIVLTGPPSVIDAIADKFMEFASRETIEVDVPSDKLSWIIGTGGKKRMELEAEHDVIVYVPQVNRGAAKDSEKVKVTGKPEQNEKAKKAILDIVRSGDGVTIPVLRRLHHRLSNEGRTKHQLRQRFSVYVSHDGVEIPFQTPAPVNGEALGRIDEDEDDETYSWHVVEDPEDTSTETIPWKLRGSNDGNLQKAKEFIENLLNSMQDQGNATGYLVIPPEHHHLVIGKGGQRIGVVREETGCTVDVPRRGDGNDTIIIRGSRDGIERAKELIVEAVEAGQHHRSNGASPQRTRR